MLGQVDADRQTVAARRGVGCQSASWRQASCEHPAADGDDQPGLLGDGDELGRVRAGRVAGAASAAAPRSRRSAGREVDDRLVVERGARRVDAPGAGRSRAASSGHGAGRAWPGRRRRGGRVPRPWRGTWRCRRRAAGPRRGRSRGRATAMPMLAVTKTSCPPRSKGRASARRGCARRPATASRRRRRRRRAGWRTRRRRAGRRCRAAREAGTRSRRATRDQQLVAGRVAEAVVDDLEAVEVEEQDGEAVGGRACAAERVLDAVQEAGARLGSPVSASWRAWKAVRSSARLRSVMSSTMPTAKRWAHGEVVGTREAVSRPRRPGRPCGGSVSQSGSGRRGRRGLAVVVEVGGDVVGMGEGGEGQA